MAVVKKTVAPVAAAKVEAPKAEVKKAAPTTPVKTETKTAVKEAEKAPVAKAEVKAPVKAEVKKPAAKKETAKKETAKKAPAKKPAAKLKSEISVQFGGKSYSQEDLLKIAKDVWKYDLKQKAADLTSVELYVKPEESMVYYVMNKETTGSFYI
jgi:cytoskeletal protein RodZ